MLNIDLLQKLLIIAITVSVIVCAFVQKTKVLFKSSKLISAYSFLVNMVLGILFCITFTDVSIDKGAWVGFFSFVGADTLYKSLEGKLKTHADLINKKSITIPEENIIKTYEVK